MFPTFYSFFILTILIIILILTHGQNIQFLKKLMMSIDTDALNRKEANL